MKEVLVLDACSLIAFFNDEKGADEVESILHKAKDNVLDVYINTINLLEIYYGVYREEGNEIANEILNKILIFPITVISEIDDNVFLESGRLKATYNISLADSIALAEAKTRKAKLVTADHHEFEVLEKNKEVSFYWIR